MTMQIVILKHLNIFYSIIVNKKQLTKQLNYHLMSQKNALSTDSVLYL